MKLILCAAGLLLASLAVADSSYRLYQGALVQGLRLGDGGEVRSSDLVCRGSECYPLYSDPPVARAYLRQLGLADYSFAALAKAKGVGRDGEALLLPPAFGAEMYRTARNDEWRNNMP